MRAFRPTRAAGGVALAALLAVPALAGWPPPGVPSGVMPWELSKYQGYNSPPPAVRPVPPPSPLTHRHPTPARSTLAVSVLPHKNTDPESRAYVMVHLPLGADLWVEDAHMIADNKLEVDTLRTPPMGKGDKWRYHFRARWLEDGKYVSQMHALDVKPGDVVCLDVLAHDATAVEKAVAESLGKLSADDRKAATAQKVCAVQDTVRLGSMGPPVKVSLKGREVFLCCEGCRAAAVKDPDKALKAAGK